MSIPDQAELDRIQKVKRFVLETVAFVRKQGYTIVRHTDGVAIGFQGLGWTCPLKELSPMGAVVLRFQPQAVCAPHVEYGFTLVLPRQTSARYYDEAQWFATGLRMACEGKQQPTCESETAQAWMQGGAEVVRELF